MDQKCLRGIFKHAEINGNISICKLSLSILVFYTASGRSGLEPWPGETVPTVTEASEEASTSPLPGWTNRSGTAHAASLTDLQAVPNRHKDTSEDAETCPADS